jgi:hypothetical protein
VVAVSLCKTFFNTGPRQVRLMISSMCAFLQNLQLSNIIGSTRVDPTLARKYEW